MGVYSCLNSNRYSIMLRADAPRTARVAPGGMVFHFLNRSVARMPLFEKPAEYQAFEKHLTVALSPLSADVASPSIGTSHLSKLPQIATGWIY
jgi:hypothetical protein